MTIEAGDNAGPAGAPERDGWSFGPGPQRVVPAAGPPRCRHPEPPALWCKAFAPPLPIEWYRIDIAYGRAGMVDARLTFVFADGTRLPQLLAKTARNRFSGLFRPLAPLAACEIEVAGSLDLARPEELRLRPVPGWERRLALARRALDVLRGDPRSFLWRAARFVVQMRRQGRATIPRSTLARSPEAAYALWRERFDETEADAALHPTRARAPATLGTGPLFSIVAASDIEAAALALLRASLAEQLYDRYELLTAGSDLAEALTRARGRFVLLPRPGTVLRPQTLLVFARAAARWPEAEILYADDDDIGRRNPRFKPAWSPQRLAGADYIGDPCAIGTALLRGASTEPSAEPVAQVGPGWRHDLLRRVSRDVPAERIVHIAQILSHAAPRPQLPPPLAPSFARPSPPPLVSLIVPTRDRADLLALSIGSIRSKTAYPHYEILVVDNGSREPETAALFASWAADPLIRVLRDDGPFNYAALNNRAAAVARGSLLGLVNNDIEVLDAVWLDAMVDLAIRPGIGCVGAKLLYPDGRLQHGGVVTGIAGAAGHRNKRAGRDARGHLDDLVGINEVSAVTAACLVVSAAIYAEVGGLDEEHFAVAYNDVDFCLRVSATGRRNLWTPFALLKHHESVSRGRDLTRRAAERFERENRALRLRWGERLLDDPYYSPNLTVDAEDGSIRTQ